MKHKKRRASDIIDYLRSDLKIAVVYAGDPGKNGTVLKRSFNPRSWKSYKVVADDICQALKRCGFKNVILLEENRYFSENLSKEKINLVWLNSAGVQGYDSACHAAAVLESIGIPYIGHTPLNSALMDQKYIFKLFLKGVGLTTAPFVLWHPEMSRRATDLVDFKQQFKDSNFPLIIKPVCGRASNHVYVVNNFSELNEFTSLVYDKTHNSILIESYLSGKEYCVAVMGDVYSHTDTLLTPLKLDEHPYFCFAHFERVLGNEPIFVSMDKVPVSHDRVRMLNTENDYQTINDLNDLACKVYKTLNLNCLVRLDVRKDSEGRINILEVNPKPDLKYPKDKVSSLIAMGLSDKSVEYDDFVFSLLVNMVNVSVRSRGNDFIESLMYG